MAMEAWRSQRFEERRGVEGVEGGMEMEGVGVVAMTAVTAVGMATVGCISGAADRGRW